MKHLLTFLLACMFGLSFGQNSDRAFYYEVEFSGDSLNVENRKSEIMVLWSAENNSVFQSLNSYKSDSIKEAVKLAKATGETDVNSFISQYSQFRPIFKYIVHKDLKDRKIVMYDKILRDNYKIDKGFSELKWDLLEEEKEVSGLACYKATINYGGRKFTAWYTVDIPINDGPYVFNGLPGLIVEISDNQGHYSFKLIGMENKEVDLTSLKLTNTISTTREKYFTARKKAFQNIHAALGDRAGQVDIETAKRVQERYDRANNPLELSFE